MIKFQLLLIVFTMFFNCAVTAKELPEKFEWPDGNLLALSFMDGGNATELWVAGS